MIYRENGQFKSSYRADQQIFPIRQDRYVVLGLLLVAFLLVPAMASNYFLQAILIPFLILSLAAIGLNILVGYCGQISIGSGAFMAVGAYAAWNFGVRIPELPLVLQILLGGVFATLVGVAFGIPSLRIRGLYLAVTTLAAQFLCGLGFPAYCLLHELLAFRQRVGACLERLWLAGSNPHAEVPVRADLRGGVCSAGQEFGAWCDWPPMDGHS